MTVAGFTPGFAGLPAGFGGPIALAPAGARAPDVVANVRVDQAWGSAQISAAAHQIRSAVLVGPTAGATPFIVGCPSGALAPGATCDFSDNEWGFALQGGVKVNLPMLAPGDELWLQAVWSSGAPGYATSGFTTLGGTGGGSNISTPINVRTTEAFINPLNGDIERVDVFSVMAALRHYWTPQLRSVFFAAYTDANVPNSGLFITATAAPGGAGGPLGTTTFTGFNDFRLYEAGANLIWSPVRNLDIGVEAVYRRLDPRGRVPFAVGGVGGVPGGAFLNTGSEDAWEGRLRVQRDF
jgi:hypothetical protein